MYRETAQLLRSVLRRRGRRWRRRGQIALRQRVAGHHLRTVGRFPYERSLDHGGLLQVFALQAVVHIVIRVVSALAVLDLVLDELEAGQTDAIEREVVRAAGIALGDGGDAEVFQRL